MLGISTTESIHKNWPVEFEMISRLFEHEIFLYNCDHVAFNKEPCYQIC